MKALTLTQPWATLVAIGEKGIETRGWSTNYRGLVAIHAAKGFAADDEATCHVEPFRSVLENGGIHRTSELPRGVIVAVAELSVVWRFTSATEAEVIVRAKRSRLPTHEAAFGNYAPGRYGFVLHNVRKLAEPVACRGMLSLWEVPADVEAAINAQLHARSA